MSTDIAGISPVVDWEQGWEVRMNDALCERYFVLEIRKGVKEDFKRAIRRAQSGQQEPLK